MTLCYHRNRTVTRAADYTGDTIIRCTDCDASIRIGYGIQLVPDLPPMPRDKPAATSELPLVVYEVRDANNTFVCKGETPVYADGAWQMPMLDHLEPGTYEIHVETHPGEWVWQEVTVATNTISPLDA